MSPHAQLYTAPFCADCDRARALLERAGITFEEIDLSRDLERRPIGGLAELDALARNGGLRRPVRAESAAAPP